jgi:hypothetical protein
MGENTVVRGGGGRREREMDEWVVEGWRVEGGGAGRQ